MYFYSTYLLTNSEGAGFEVGSHSNLILCFFFESLWPNTKVALQASHDSLLPNTLHSDAE